MRLFLASQDFGRHADVLSDMVGKNRKVLVVFNARDLKEDRGGERTQSLLNENNLQFVELDLRNYFGKTQELREYVDEYGPGMVLLLGGNTFLLRRAMSQSGFDEILQEDVSDDRYVLAGYSAGAIVAGPSLRGYERMDNEKIVPSQYKKEVVWKGLALTDVRIIPHANSDKYERAIAEMRKVVFDREEWSYVVLNDTDVFVVNGDKSEVLR